MCLGIMEIIRHLLQINRFISAKKATEIANEILRESEAEEIAIAKGLKHARQHFKDYPKAPNKATFGIRNELMEAFSVHLVSQINCSNQTY